MSEIFTAIFDPEYTHTSLSLSSFTITIVVEGFHSLISEAIEAGDNCFGVVTRQKIIEALLIIHRVHGSFDPAPERGPISADLVGENRRNYHFG
jgi:hypothetical protein